MPSAMQILAFLRALFLARTHLALENLALRQQVAVLKRSVPRPRVHRRDRIFWVLLRRFWPEWRDSLALVKPATVVAWHRQGWRLLWKLKSRGKPGRPAVSLELRELIRRLSRENRLWGAPRIQLELEHLGYHVAMSTIDKYRDRRFGPPSQTWRAFLANHGSEILACDFFTIPTATFGTITGFVVMELGRRRIVACDVTAHPTAAWATGIVRRAHLAAGRRGQYLLRDRDAIYGKEFTHVVRELGLRQLVTAYKSPRQNAHAERVIGTIRRECLDHMIILGERHAWHLLHEFAAYYNADRAHQALDGDAPESRRGSSSGTGHLVAVPHLGGLHHSYRRAA